MSIQSKTKQGIVSIKVMIGDQKILVEIPEDATDVQIMSGFANMAVAVEEAIRGEKTRAYGEMH